MTEIVVSSPPARDRLRAFQLAGLAVGSALVAAGLVFLHARPAPDVAAHARAAAAPAAHAHARPAHERASHARPVHELPARAQRAEPYTPVAREAALGLDRGLFTSTPGGAFATAARVAQWRPLVVRAARRGHVDANLLEAIVFVESSGEPDAMAGSDPASASGLTQIVASTATRFLHMRVHLGSSRLLTYRIRRAEWRGHWRHASALAARRRRADQRFAPRHALAATVRYLDVARRDLGRTDLAVASYHMGIGNLQQVIRLWAAAPRGASTRELVRSDAISYGKLYFASAPDRHAAAWLRLTGLGDMTRDYYWKVLAAERVMRLWRHDRGALAFEAMQQFRKSSAEEVLHPRAVTHVFSSPRALHRAWRQHVLRLIPRDAASTHVVVSGTLGQMAYRLGRSRRLYRGLRPDALATLLFIGRRVHELSGSRRPLIVTSAVRDLVYQRVLGSHNAAAARFYSLHTTGYAFDIARSYGSRREAAAFQFVLERLQALHLIAYIKEPEAIHIAVASHAAARLRALRGDD
jgi:soluble lytic murein transglycosylase-like protein